ncbi:hypothetical protein ACFFLS_10610 [Flavobacterium procerum]|uniref:DUF6438 domain-containing protein n=1 Tax=Flavobacterium procerum TaxID=1455569 RepID=A0ABV6BPW2_9FLAO
MTKNYCFLLILSLCISCQKYSQKEIRDNNSDSVIKVEMHLDGFGVEGDNFPSSIVGEIDFENKKSNFEKDYYDPSIKASTYVLSDKEIKTLFELIQKADLTKLKKEYSIGDNRPDQPRSKMTIYTEYNQYEIDDYGLRGDTLLIKIYDIAYKI